MPPPVQPPYQGQPPAYPVQPQPYQPQPQPYPYQPQPYQPQPGYPNTYPNAAAPAYPNVPAPSPYPNATPPDSSAPRKLHIPVQVRNEAAHWLTVRGTPPLLLKSTLHAYREVRCGKRVPSCKLSDAELLAELLEDTEKPAAQNPY